MERKNYLTPILIFLILILLGIIAYFVVKNNSNSNNNVQDTDQTIKWEVKTDKYYSGLAYFKTSAEDGGEIIEYHAEILLKPDGTFVETSGTFVFSGYDGTYTINNNILTLTAAREYGSDACYRTSNEVMTYQIYEIDNNEKLYQKVNLWGTTDLFLNVTTKDKIESTDANFLLNPTKGYELCE